MRTPVRRVLFDINVVLDVLLNREPHVDASTAIWIAVETGKAEALLAAHAVTTIHYLLAKQLGNTKATRTMAAILGVFGVATVDGMVIQEALQLPMGDFEDAVTAAAARSSGCQFIVTRDPKGFRGSPLRCLTPEAAAPILQAE